MLSDILRSRATLVILPDSLSLEVHMLRRLFFVGFSCLVALLLSSCGGGSHQIQSVSVVPTFADAQNSPNGRVQFTATGHYKTSPLTVTPLKATWSAALGPATTAVTVDANGVAQCNAGSSGTFAIGAWVPMDPNSPVTCMVIGPFGERGCDTVTGTAELTCP
jgi:hypothetical protein